MVNSKIHLVPLYDELVILHPLRPKDFNDLWILASNIKVWEQHPARERATPEGFKQFFNESLLQRSSYAIRDHQGNMAGMSSYYEHDDYHKMISVGYTFFGIEFWGKGYNPHVKNLMINYAFDELGVDHVLFHVDENNFRSQHALDKMGIKKINDIHTIKKGDMERHNLLFMKSRNL
jgi:RimJ/RimL family protein N-acetyltransferase